MKVSIRLLLFSCLYAIALPFEALPQDTIQTEIVQKLKGPGRFVHHLGIEFRPAYILPTAPFYRGENLRQKPIRTALSGHLKYAFRFPDGSLGDKVYPDTYQGIGIAHYGFDNPEELGRPTAIYLFQRSEIARLGDRIALDYEWNFGISTGWKPHHFERNPYNVAIGSGTNAYLNAGIYLRWALTRHTDLATGIDFTHFSNGNTTFPNAGLNMVGLKIGMLYDFRKRQPAAEPAVSIPESLMKRYPRHISYDLVLFGSWRRKGVEVSGQPVPSPHQYPVLGLYFAPMYNLSHRFRTGLSLDAVYDGSANVYTRNYHSAAAGQKFFKPSADQQLALGMSARAEYIMPIFTIGIGLGGNVLHKGGDLRGTYQTFALKIATTRNSFLHIGYNLKDFHEPNYLMLGLGYRFNNKAPSLFR
ncbi:acyloxyacyl hydrolase [Sinomicrobium soli]|uniref:acyloxyacyl hydrolase n=1 Tax=Sinomicrobium sp. N-1-3-6 TaxID=2219864 RepID=UPI000DCD87FA|nr:acyloxyacyl hydrolase [Sinomicrobium sp. N-1-3-6]RAV30476.1 acyloxyacyl hydrolase [Sinomicrobium sp. N-1-3-6]